MDKRRVEEIVLIKDNAQKKIEEYAHDLGKEVIDAILKKYPNMVITTQERYEEGYEYWILVDKGMFKNNEFLQLVSDIDDKILFPNHGEDIYIAERF